MRNTEIIGWCAYCKDPIYQDEPYEVEGSMIFHPECLVQKNSYSGFLDSDIEDDLDDFEIDEEECN